MTRGDKSLPRPRGRPPKHPRLPTLLATPQRPPPHSQRRSQPVQEVPRFRMEIDDQIPNQNPTDPGQSSRSWEQSMKVDMELMEKHLQCPICRGIRQQSRITKDCLHRFCKECIDKAMRNGNHECPVCRAHLASTRSLVADSRSDIVIEILYPNLRGSSDDDLKLTDEERSKIKQLQASFVQTLQRQEEALERFPRPYVFFPRRRSRGSGRKGRQRRINNTGIERLNDTKDGRDSGIEPLSSDQLSSPADSGFGFSNLDTDMHDEVVVNREVPAPREHFIETSNVPAWGKGGHRSQIRRDKCCGSRNDQIKDTLNLEGDMDLLSLDITNNGKGKMEETNSSGPTNFIVGEGIDDGDSDDDNDSDDDDDDDDDDYGEEFDELEMPVALISLDVQIFEQLVPPYKYFPVTHSVKHICQHVSKTFRIPLKEVKLLLITDPVFNPSDPVPKYNPSKGYARLVKSKTKLKNLRAMCNPDYMMVLAYVRLPDHTHVKCDEIWCIWG